MLPRAPELVTSAVLLALLLSLPVLAAAAGVGLLAGLAGALTNVHDRAPAQLARVAVVGLVLVASGAWAGRLVLAFATSLWTAAPTLVR